VPDLSKITSIEDLRVVAQRRVPRMFYDYADSGAWTEGTYRANESDFNAIKLRQRVAINMEGRSTRTTMIGEEVAMPVAIAPTGMTATSSSGSSTAPRRPTVPRCN
jgi:L-lactate dehydrogenase (cytochrome)